MLVVLIIILCVISKKSFKMTASQQITKASAAKPPPKTYGRIILTLYNCLLPESAFKETPSQSDGLDIETETDLRILGCELIQTAGILLRLPQVAMATAQVYLQRFYYSKSFVRYPMETMAMGSILLASKVEEKPTHIRDILNVFHHIKQVRAQKPITPLLPDHSSHNYQELRNQVVKAERRILKELGFCVHVKHPHKLIVVYLQLLTYEKNKQLMQISWNYMNDALRTDVFMRFPPETIACACIYLTARRIGLPLPNNPHWFSLFSVKEEDIRNVCIKILRLYKRPKLNSDELERKVDTLKRVYQANKILQAKKNKEASKAIATKEKSNSPSVSSKDEKRNNDKVNTKSTTPPLKHHSNRMKAKHERRSRSPYDRKDRYKSRHRSRSPMVSPRRDRSRDERRNDDKRRDRGYISNSSNSSQTRKYEDYERSKTRDSRDEKRSKY